MRNSPPFLLPFFSRERREEGGRDGERAGEKQTMRGIRRVRKEGEKKDDDSPVRPLKMETEYPPFLPSRPLHPARGCARFPNRHTDEKGEGRAKRGRRGGGGSRRRDLENDSCLRKRGLLCFSSHGTLYTVPKVPLDLGQVRPLVRSNSRLFGTRSSVGVYPISIQHRCTTAPAPPRPSGGRVGAKRSTGRFYFRILRIFSRTSTVQ